MKNRLLFTMICFFLFASCQNKKANSNIGIKKDTVAESLRKKLIGKWGYKKEVSYVINADSIYSVETNSSSPYKLKGDTFMVKSSTIDTFITWGKLEVIRDTLIIIDYNMRNFKTYGYRIND